MGNIGGKRNYGYGKQIAWAGQQALLDRYGSGHYATRAAHSERWLQFVKYAKEQDINDARNITPKTIEHYARTLKRAVEQKTLSIAYAQNLLSTVNVVLEALRKDRQLAISPKQWVGERCHVRQTPPCLDKSHVFDSGTMTQSSDTTAQNLDIKAQSFGTNTRSSNTAIQSLAASHDQPEKLHNEEKQTRSHRARIILVARLARDFGLRFREASLLDARQALKEAQQRQAINITQGTKGGRGKGKDRWVPVTHETLDTLKQATELQEQHRNLIPAEMNYIQWRNHAYSQWRQIAKPFGIKGFHELRAAYACERYQQLTGYPAPVMTNGVRTAPIDADHKARIVLAQALGHNRVDVISAYVAGTKSS
jgi:hypothetical protein